VTTLLLIAATVALIINFKHSGIALPQILTAEMAQQKWSQLDEEAQRLFDDGQYAQAQRNFADELKLAEHLDPKYEKASLEGLLDASYVIHGDGNEAATTEWRSRLAAINATTIDTRQMNDELLKVQSPKEAKETIGKAIALAVRMKKAEKSWLADKLLDTAVNVANRFLGAKDALLAECLSTQADMYQIQESHGDKELQLRTQAEAIREANKQDPLALAMAQMELANIYYRKGIKDQTQTWAKPDYWYGQAIESFKNWQSTHNKLEDQHYGEIARCECDRASCEGNLNHNDEGLECLKRSREDLEKLTPGIDLDSLPVPMLKNVDWHLLTCENWNLWAELEKQKKYLSRTKEQCETQSMKKHSII
jgi:hypothetical protein